MVTKSTGRVSHKVYHPGRRHMELVPSVSRSSGLDKDGDALRNYKVQAEYREFIQEKLEKFWRSYSYSSCAAAADAKQRRDEQENILILFRKLREGLLSTKRSDAFALEVYETSLYLSIIFRSPKQTSSILSHLLPHLYLSSTSTGLFRTHRALPATLISLFHHILEGYPSQSRYYEHLHSLPRAFLPRESEAYQWLNGLARSLRTRNFARLDRLTQQEAFERFISTDSPPASAGVSPMPPNSEANVSPGAPANLAREALSTLVDALRQRARETTWLVLRSAYRELHCPPASVSAGDDGNATTEVPPSTRDWLARSLTLRPIMSDNEQPPDIGKLVDEWLMQKSAVGEVRRKEGPGMEDRWIVCKVSTQ